MIRAIVIAGIFMLFATTAGAEYYQYTDESGNLRFTDDMTQIPESQRDAVEKFTTETSTVGGTEADAGAVPSESSESPERAEPAETAQYDIPGHQTLNVKAEELNRIQEGLNRTRAALEAERSELQAQAPEENATVTDKIAYSMRVDALNDKIDAYEKDLKAFMEKVNAFNNPGPPPAQQEGSNL